MNSRVEEKLVTEGEDFFRTSVEVMEGQLRGEDFYVPGIKAFTEEEVAKYAGEISRVRSYLKNHRGVAA